MAGGATTYPAVREEGLVRKLTRFGPRPTSISRWAAIAVATLLGGSAGGAATTEPAVPGLSPELEQPVQVEAGGKPIDVEIGHAAPFFADFDGDGKKDRLVGQFGGGKLRVYRNVGSNEKPAFDAFTWFKAGAETGQVPAS